MLENIKKVTNNIPFSIQNSLMYIITAFFIAIASQVSIPLPNGVPLTLQTFTIAMIGFCFSTNKGIKSILTYLLLGVLGFPLFASGKSGFGTLFGLTGGFILGFILLVLFCSKTKKINSFSLKVLFSFIGLISCHFLGVLQYSIITGINFYQAFLLVSLPFLLKDSLSIILALIIYQKILKQKIAITNFKKLVALKLH